GDVDAEQAFALGERYYGDMPAGEPVRDAGPAEPERAGVRIRQLSGDVVQARIEFGWRTPGALDADTPALDLLALILGQGRASRLYGAVREAGLVTDIGAYNYTPGGIGVFGVSAESRPVTVPAALGAIGRTVAATATGPSAAELERAKTLLDARWLRRHETVEGQANMLAEWQALGDWRLA